MGQKRRFFTFCRTYMVYSMLVPLLLTNIAQNLRTNQPVLARNAILHPMRQITQNQFNSNVTWVRIPPSAPRTAPCGVLLFIFATNYARAARWDSNNPCPALCVPPGCNSPADCCKGAGESHRLHQVSLLNSTLGSDFLSLVCKIPLLFL